MGRTPVGVGTTAGVKGPFELRNADSFLEEFLRRRGLVKQRLLEILSIFERLVVVMFTGSRPFAGDSFSTRLFFNHSCFLTR